ncbi:hypothetical protein SSCI18S_03991 [Sphingobium scionense]
MLTNWALARRLRWWIMRATSSLPVPVSPSTNMSILVSAKVATMSRSRSIAGEWPISGEGTAVSTIARRRRFSITSSLFSLARATEASRASGSKGLVRKSHAPVFSASTAIGTSPWPVTRMTGSSASRALSARNRSMPDMCGIRTSLTTTPGKSASIAASASAARAKARTSWPASISVCAMAARRSSSSSTRAIGRGAMSVMRVANSAGNGCRPRRAAGAATRPYRP